MSCFIVSKEHIDAMVDLALRGPADIDRRRDTWHGLSWGEGGNAHRMDPERAGCSLELADRVGQMLVTENILSVQYRYDDGAPEMMDSWQENYSFPWEQITVSRWTGQYGPARRRPTAVEGLKIIDCYEYQASEHDGWETSEAAQFCRSLTEALIGHLPGYDAAPWGWDIEHAYEQKKETVR